MTTEDDDSFVASEAVEGDTLALNVPVMRVLYDNVPQRESLIEATVLGAVGSLEGWERADDERRVAFAYGKTEHGEHTDTGLCTDACEIVGCDEGDAEIVMIRVEITVRRVG